MGVEQGSTSQRAEEWPIDVALPERVIFNGVIMATLRTIGELESFWFKHRANFPCAAGCGLEGGGRLLHPHQWVFGFSEIALIKALMRWDHFSMQCKFYDYALAEPKENAETLRLISEDRAEAMLGGTWTPKREAQYQDRCEGEGCWVLDNFPNGTQDIEWIEEVTYEYRDRKMAVVEVEALLLAHMFDDWVDDPEGMLRVFAHGRLTKEIAGMKRDKKNGLFYYGRDNEALH